MAKFDSYGYTLTEACLVCAVGAILLASAIPLFDTAMHSNDADAAAQLIVQELTHARTMAIGNGSGVLIRFDPAANSVVVAPGTGSVKGPFILPGRTKLQTNAPSLDTPDNLNSKVLGVGAFQQMTFLNNGAVVDNPAANNIISGTFFLENDNQDPSTRRAVTIFGATGKIKMWRFDDGSNTWK